MNSAPHSSIATASTNITHAQFIPAAIPDLFFPRSPVVKSGFYLTPRCRTITIANTLLIQPRCAGERGSRERLQDEEVEG